jgi:hypothetical protein
MALKRHGEAFKFGTGDNELLSKTTQKRYGSEVEIVKGNGEVYDVIYSGEESTITETRIKDAFKFAGEKMGDGNLSSGGVLTRISLQASNEDLVRVEQEKLEIKL